MCCKKIKQITKKKNTDQIEDSGDTEKGFVQFLKDSFAKHLSERDVLAAALVVLDDDLLQ